jgi:copper chaperone CopZ
LPGVTKVDVDFDRKTATVTAEKGRVEPEKLVTTLEEKTEFKAKVQ